MPEWMDTLRKIIGSPWQRMPRSWHFAILSVLLARVLFTLWSIAVLTYLPQYCRNLEFSGEPVMVDFDLQTSGGYAFNRTLDGKILIFQAAGTGFMQDVQTGSLWNLASGQAQTGPLAGKKLQLSKFGGEDFFPYFGIQKTAPPILALWQRYDANWYLSIAHYGYGHIPGDVHFQPLFPLLIRFVTLFLGNEILAGLLVTQLATLFMIKLLYDLFEEWGGPPAAQNSIFYLLIFPTSFFLFSVYTESFYIVFAILALQTMLREHWGWSGFWIALAILTRLQGVVLLLPLAYCLWRARSRIKIISAAATLILPGLAVLVYLAIRAANGSEEIIPLTERSLNAKMVFPWENLIYPLRYIATGTFNYINILNLLVTLLFGGLLVFGWKKNSAGIPDLFCCHDRPAHNAPG